MLNDLQTGDILKQAVFNGTRKNEKGEEVFGGYFTESKILWISGPLYFLSWPILSEENLETKNDTFNKFHLHKANIFTLKDLEAHGYFKD